MVETKPIAMNIFNITIVNIAALVLLGLYAYFASATPSFTALIPVFAGLVLAAFLPGIYNNSHTQLIIILIISAVLLVSFIKPLTGALHRQHVGAVVRVVIMMATTLLAVIFYIKDLVGKNG